MIGLVKKEDRAPLSGVCTGCGTEGTIYPLITLGDQTLSICEDCLNIKQPEPVATPETVETKTGDEPVLGENEIFTELEARVADLEKAVIALTKREVNRLASQMGVADAQ